MDLSTTSSSTRHNHQQLVVPVDQISLVTDKDRRNNKTTQRIAKSVFSIRSIVDFENKHNSISERLALTLDDSSKNNNNHQGLHFTHSLLLRFFMFLFFYIHKLF